MFVFVLGRGTLNQLVTVKLHGRKRERIARELPAVLEQGLGAEESLFSGAKLDEPVLGVDHADDDTSAVGDHLDIARLLGDAGEEGSVLLVGELLLHPLSCKVPLDKRCGRVSRTDQSQSGVEGLSCLRDIWLTRPYACILLD